MEVRPINVEITKASAEDGPRLLALLELYAYDFSEIMDVDVQDDGRFHVPSIDRYWTDARCQAYLTRADGKLAGFALVQERSRLTGDEGVRDMAEFFVLRRYRRRGVGEHAARWLWDHFRGPWEIRERAANRAATTFWRQIIERYTGGRFEDLVLDDDRWRGPVQRFDSSLVASSMP